MLGAEDAAPNIPCVVALYNETIKFVQKILKKSWIFEFDGVYLTRF